MSLDIIIDLNLEQLRVQFIRYTRKAFHMLPKMDQPCILDIGCGSGIPTLELAQLSNGEIIGIDIDQDALDKLKIKIEKMELTDRVKFINTSLYNSNLPSSSFDILWDEGVIHILDLKKSLRECNRLLKLNGYLVAGEMIKWIENKFKTFSKFGFKLINQFLLPKNCWWTEYYAPLEKKVIELRLRYSHAEDLEKLKPYEREIEMVKKNPQEFDCGFYIMQKIK